MEGRPADGHKRSAMESRYPRIFARISQEELTEVRVASIERQVWSVQFGPFDESDLDLRMPSFQRIAKQILRV
jgi:hypothetical protein